VPDQTRRALKTRAAARGESLNAYRLDVIEREVARPAVREVLDRAARRAGTVNTSSLDAVEAARRERDEQLRAGPDP